MFKKLFAPLLAFLAFMLGLSAPAHAALPTVVTDSITAAGADLSTAASAIIAAMVAFWGLRKLGAKMGWW